VIAVLDTSAVLALILKEPGGARVVDYLNGSKMSAVNYAEILRVLGRLGIDIGTAQTLMSVLRIDIVPLTADIAVGAAKLGNAGSPYGLSLGDRSCLATAGALGASAVTADRVWSDLEIDVDVISVR